MTHCSDHRGAAIRLRRIPWLSALALSASLAGCGGDGGGPASTPAPVPSPSASPTPSPTPTPTPTPTTAPGLIPASTFQTAEYARSDGPVYHQAIPAWQTGASGAGVTVAIVDNGIDTANTEFSGRIAAASRDVAGSRSLTGPDDHGTQVALIAAAARNNSGIVGVAWGATVLMARADTPGTCGSAGGCSFDDADIAAGVDLAVSSGARVINLSLGGSGPTAVLTQAIARAASAGVVVIVAAGNEGASTTPGIDPNNPDPLATGLRQAGNGNVIIAGSIDAKGQISSFSNRAGSEASWFLSARGEALCCVYSGSQIEITTSGGQQFETLVSGTSFAAPQIAGAAALLLEAFPNLTADQVVELLLSSATDAGAAGTDGTYGRGVLNIANAFAAKGATTLAGNKTLAPLGSTSLTTSAAMGDGGQGAVLAATVLDGYQRAYRVDLGQSVRAAPVVPRLAGALLDSGRPVTAGAGRAALAFTVGQADPASFAWSGALRLSRDEAQGARVLAARVATRIAPGTDLAFGMAQGADGLSAQLAGQIGSGPAFLVAGDSRDDFGFARSGLAATALRRQIGRFGVTLAAEGGEVSTGEPRRLGRMPDAAQDRHAPFTRFALAADRRFGNLGLRATASWLAEDRSVLGAMLDPGLAPRGADSLFIDLAGQWQFAPAWTLAGDWRRGMTHARGGAVVTDGSNLASNGWSIDLLHTGLLQEGDSLGLRLSRPLRVTSGGLSLLLPDHWDYTTRTASMAVQRLALVPSGRETDAELAWRGALWGGQATASLYWREQPGHIAAMPPEQGAAIGWAVSF